MQHFKKNQTSQYICSMSHKHICYIPIKWEWVKFLENSHTERERPVKDVFSEEYQGTLHSLLNLSFLAFHFVCLCSSFHCCSWVLQMCRAVSSPGIPCWQLCAQKRRAHLTPCRLRLWLFCLWYTMEQMPWSGASIHSLIILISKAKASAPVI